ncbi:MAG: hypothetical protein ABIS20_10070 [Thermoanaerobaculia bacterium]
MSFKSRDLMIDVLPARKFNALAQPGLGMCAQGTANTGTEEEDEEKDCAQGTATTNEPAYAPRTEVNLALLRQQLYEALSSTAQA